MHTCLVVSTRARIGCCFGKLATLSLLVLTCRSGVSSTDMEFCVSVSHAHRQGHDYDYIIYPKSCLWFMKPDICIAQQYSPATG